MSFRLHLMLVGDSSIRDYILYLNEHGRPAQLLLLSLLLPLYSIRAVKLELPPIVPS